MKHMEFDLSLAQKPSLARRLGAMLYDSLLLVGILMIALGLVVVPYGLLTGEELHQHHRLLEQLYIFFVVGAFYVYFWTHGGQTLGMRAWRLRLVTAAGGNIGLSVAVKRFLLAVPSIALLGLGLWVSMFDRDGLAWHDRQSQTRVVLLPKAA